MLEPGPDLNLPALGSWPQTPHHFDEPSIYAINAAIAAERPLLVRGEPGIGKSQLARAAAHALGRLFVSEVVHARTRGEDLLWQFDAVGRLGEAQALGALSIDGKAELEQLLSPKRFLSPGPLWWVLNWESAEAQYQVGRKRVRKPQSTNWQSSLGSLLLIDEIDKADADVPNGLLEALGNGAFNVPYLDQTINADKNCPPPLVIITTNEERQLPMAFVRRCLVLHLEPPKDEKEFEDWLVKRGMIHFSRNCSEEVMRVAAGLLVNDRKEAIEQGLPRPGQAEYLDMLRAVSRMAADNETRQRELLGKIRAFTLHKASRDSI